MHKKKSGSEDDEGAMHEAAEAARRPENTLTDQQKGELRAWFDAFDEDGSGFLDKREVANALRNLGLCSSEREIEQSIREIDMNGDVKIQWHEYLSFMAKFLVSPKHSNAEIDMAFDVLKSACAIERAEELSKLDFINGPLAEIFRVSAQIAQRKLESGGEEQTLETNSKWKKKALFAKATKAGESKAGGSKAGESKAGEEGRSTSRRSRGEGTKGDPGPETVAERARQSLFRMSSRPLEIMEPEIDCATLRLILTDAGSPLSEEEMNRLLQLADPDSKGVVSWQTLRNLPCWLTEEEEERVRTNEERIRMSRMFGSAPATESGPSSTEKELVVYATVPEGVQPGDVIAIEAAGKVLQAVVPQGCGPGDTFGVVE